MASNSSNISYTIITSVIVLMLFASCTKHRQCFLTTDYYVANLTDKVLLYEYEYDKWSNYTICQGIVINHKFQGDSNFCNDIRVCHKEGGRGYKIWIYIPRESGYQHFFTDQYDEDYRYASGELLCSNQRMRKAFRRVLYNIADTTSVELPVDVFLDKSLETTAKYRDMADSVHWTYRLTVTDSLLSLMQKDTSMLRLFPDYYGGE